VRSTGIGGSSGSKAVLGNRLSKIFSGFEGSELIFDDSATRFKPFHSPDLPELRRELIQEPPGYRALIDC
jgi:hypothetical protein